jgi:hypothetical protein
MLDARKGRMLRLEEPNNLWANMEFWLEIGVAIL